MSFDWRLVAFDVFCCLLWLFLTGNFCWLLEWCSMASGVSFDATVGFCWLLMAAGVFCGCF
jgi:hypothetical protein